MLMSLSLVVLYFTSVSPRCACSTIGKIKRASINNGQLNAVSTQSEEELLVTDHYDCATTNDTRVQM